MSGTPLSGKRYRYSLALATSLGGFSAGDLCARDGVWWLSLVNSNMVAPTEGAYWEFFA